MNHREPSRHEQSRPQAKQGKAEGGKVTSGFPPRSARSLAAALRDALLKLEAERLASTARQNPDDDDEDPTRRLGHQD